MHSSSKTLFFTLHALPSLPHTARNTSGYGFPSTPTSCLYVRCKSMFWLIKDSILHSPCTALTPPYPQEYLWLQLPLHSHLMFICVLHRPPNSDDSIYTSLSENMDQLLFSHPNSLFLICGDLNCHHASWLCVGTSLTCQGTSAKDFCDFSCPTLPPAHGTRKLVVRPLS